MSWLDLHMHSRISGDGEFAPGKMMELCQKAGVRVAAIADHNSIRGLSEAAKAAEKYAVTLIPAVELDCQHNGINLHVLGYKIDYQAHAKIFDEIEQEIFQQEKIASVKRLQKIREMGIFIDEEKVYQLVGKDRVIEVESMVYVAMQDTRNCHHPLLQPYFPGGMRSDSPFVNFYWDYFSQGKPSYVHVEFIRLAEAVAVIEKAGGVAILAHPGNNIGRKETLLHEIIEAGVKGVEVYSSYHDLLTIDFYKSMTEKYKLLTTAGSDFHGRAKPSIRLGDISVEKREQEIFTRLMEAGRRDI